MLKATEDWKKKYDAKQAVATARESLGARVHRGPFSLYDCWCMVNFQFLSDSVVYRLCLLANLMSDKEIDVKMWVEDPIAFAQCVSLVDLTVNTKVIESRLKMMKKSGHVMWEEMILSNKIIFIPINYPAQDHWVAGKSLLCH